MELSGRNIPEYTVSEFNTVLRETVSSTFDLVKIRGEISNLKKPSSGHIYFNLKDEDSVINAVCWRGNISKLRFKPEDGLEIIAIGKISTFAKSISTYQIDISEIEIAGIGALLKIVEDRKKMFQKMGFFEEDKKLPIPLIPENIGLITSPTGSVIKDIIHRIKERFPKPIQLWPVSVQGENCAQEIIRAIKGFNSFEIQDKPDVIIIARGGGSIEDLMPFNDSDLVKAIFYSKIPIISAIGHDTDNPIIDLVSDLRAPTPTAAAEKCVPVRFELEKKIELLFNSINNYNLQIIKKNKNDFQKLIRLIQDPSQIIKIFSSNLNKLIYLKESVVKNFILENINKIANLNSYIKHPGEKLKNQNMILHNLIYKINLIFKSNIYNEQNKIKELSRVLNLSSIDNSLKRGYAIIKKEKKIITSSNSIKNNDLVDIQFYSSKVSAKIKKN